MSAPTFSRGTVVALVGVCAVSLVGGIVLSILGPGETPTSAGNDGFSDSAIGHTAFAAFLEAAGVPVLRSRWASETRAGKDSLLALVEPRDDPSAIARVAGRADRLLVVLPKRVASRLEARRDWVAEPSLVDPSRVQRALEAVGIEGRVVRRSVPDAGWSPPGGPSPTFPLEPLQVVEASDLVPIVAVAGGTLVGETRGRRRTIVISDPDLVANAGLHRGGNAEIALAAVRRLLPPGGAVVLDETLHGHSRRPSMWKELFAFPLGLVTAHAALTVLLLLWAGTARFGPPLREGPALEHGSGLLLRNAADLLGSGRHQGLVLRSFLREALARARADLRAPAQLPEREAREWLDRVAARRGVQTRVADLEASVERALVSGTAGAAVHAARGIHRWKEEIRHGAGRRPIAS